MQTSRNIKPNMDIIDFGTKLCLLVDLPGVPEQNILLEIIHDTLHLEAQMELNIKEDEQILTMDFAEDLFVFNFKLADSLQHESLYAKMHNGLLCICLDFIDKKEVKHVPIEFT